MSSSSDILNLVVYLPAVVALILACLPKEQTNWFKGGALIGAILTMLVSFTLIKEFTVTDNATYQFITDLPWIANCPSALDLDAYPYSDRRGEYLLFIGRMSPQKGAGRAIAVAQEMGLPLKLAGKMHEADERAYFAREVAPHLSDRIEYLGEVSHEEKVRLLQRARCTLFPIDWEEPFGLVMLESMACGTPVVATRRGAVPEVISPGESGVIVDRYEDLPGAVAQADQIDPASCRDYVETHFSEARMVRNYLEAFSSLLG